MKKLYILIFPIVLLTACNGNKNKETEQKSEFKELVIPSGYKLIKKVDGDLDKDKKDERIFVYDTDSVSDLGTERIIYICKKENEKWMEWKSFYGPVLPSEAGGVQGEPFDDILIDDGKIYITHTGGASERWYYNHCFEFIDKEFRLTKAVIDLGRPCVKWETYIYDLKTGSLSYDLAPDECSDEIIEKYVISAHYDYTVKKTDLPKMSGFCPGDNKLNVPKTKNVIYY